LRLLAGLKREIGALGRRFTDAGDAVASGSMLIRMRDRELYATILGLSAPWKVVDVDLEPDQQMVDVHVEAAGVRRLPCPECAEPCPKRDHRVRRWRHLDTCQYRTTLVAKVPRVECPTHGVLQVKVPWAETGSRFTALFEAIAIDWLREASANAVSRRLGLSWDEVDGIMQRAVKRGLARRAVKSVTGIGIDETSFQKRHEYVTVVNDLNDGEVLYVADDRKEASLDGFFDQYAPGELLEIEVVAMDMWAPYIRAVEENILGADKRICFDKFHVAKHLGDAVDKVRRQEHRSLLEQDDHTLTRTKYIWLQNPCNMGKRARASLKQLKDLALKTARAWALKENAMSLWQYVSRTWAKKAWKAWIAWAMRSRLEPMKRVARMVRDHLYGIINAIVFQATNARAESINSKIQRVKRMACGYRNRERFRNAIYFHLGGLDMMPATHTES
jgi:transposase